MQIFRIKKGWRIFIYIFLVLFAFLFLVLLFAPLLRFKIIETHPENDWIFSLCAIPCLFFIVVGWMDTVKSNITLLDHEIIVQNVWGKKSLLVQEIQGYQFDQNYIFIIPALEGKKRLKIHEYFEGIETIIGWLAERFLDLDEEHQVLEEETILASEDYGSDVHAREQSLELARNQAKWINRIGITCGLWLFLYPEPYGICLLLNLIFLIGMLGFVLKSKGLIRILDEKKSACPHVTTPLLVITFGFFIRALMDVNLIEQTPIWMYTSAITIVGTIFYCYGNWEIKMNPNRKWLLILWTFIWMGTATYGTLALGNKELDESQAQVFLTKINGKRISSGKSTTYYVEFQPWDPKLNIDDIKVSQSEYDYYSVGQTVAIQVREGFFHFKWYYLVGQK